MKKFAGYASSTRNSGLFTDDGRLGEFEGGHKLWYDVPRCMHVFAWASKLGTDGGGTANCASAIRQLNLSLRKCASRATVVDVSR